VKAVLDSSVLVSAFLTPGGSPGRVLAAGLDGRFGVILSGPILAETARSLQNRPGLAARYGYTDAEAARYVADLAGAATVPGELRAIAPVCRDPEDDHVLAAAVTAEAGFIVSGDRDLLELGAYEGVRILAPRPFLDLLASGRSA
jgi:uncharacterized protein